MVSSQMQEPQRPSDDKATVDRLFRLHVGADRLVSQRFLTGLRRPTNAPPVLPPRD
jgi:hypothetical protein